MKKTMMYTLLALLLMAEGVYLLRIMDAEGKVYTNKRLLITAP